MASTPSNGQAVKPTEIAHEAIALVRKWLEISRSAPKDESAERLAGVLKDPNGLDFTMGFVDRVVRPEDLSVAGVNLGKVAKKAPRFLPQAMQAAIRVGGFTAPGVPWAVVPIARRVLRQMVSHLIIDATPAKLTKSIAKLTQDGETRLNINLLGEAVLGHEEAARRLEGTLELLKRRDVDYVSVKVSSVAAQLNMWAFDETVDRIVENLTPLYRYAAQSPTPKFINLDMEEYRDLDLTMAVFKKLLAKEELKGLQAGIVLQAYLPDALGALKDLTAFAKQRRAEGGAGIKVRVVKGANLAMETVDARVHGWPLATYSRKVDTDTNYKRVLDFALRPENIEAVRIGVAGHNLFDIAFALVLARKRGAMQGVEFEMLLGMATEQAYAIRQEPDISHLLLYTPVVKPAEFDVAISYLVRRLEENASSDNFMSAVFELDENEAMFEREQQRFLDSIALLDDAVPTPNRVQDRGSEWSETERDEHGGRVRASRPAPDEDASDPLSSTGPLTADLTNAVLGVRKTQATRRGFTNEPDTDPSTAENREWAARILARVPGSTLGTETLEACEVADQATLDAIIDVVEKAGEEWGAKSGKERAAIIDRAGLALAANRDRLIEVAASECGKTIAETDPEISEAVDFAHYYASSARLLDRVQGARFVPSRLTLVVPPWNFPIAIPAGGVLAALAAGSGVIIKPAPQARRSAAVMVEALWEAGIPKNLLALVDFTDAPNGEGDLGRSLISSPRVDRVILTGSFDTAKLFRSWRRDLPILAETSGKNAIIVTPSADLDLAASDVVRSAFGHAGQKCSAASLVILVGSVARSKRFIGQLRDATRSMKVGYPDDPTTQIGPIIEPAEGKLKYALTELGGGESWLVEPKQLDDTGRLWSPGVRLGVEPGSYTHLTEFFGPHLSVMTAPNLAEAIRLANATEFGLTSGLHSLDPNELAQWLNGIEAGNLYVNRGITGAIVERQSFGGWKRSVVGPGTKAGGPNYLLALGEWTAHEGEQSSSLHLRGLDDRVASLIEATQPYLSYDEFDLLRRSALSDAVAWHDEFGQVVDPSGIDLERNLFRYLPVQTTIRASESATLEELVRVIAAARIARSVPLVSSGIDVPDTIKALLLEHDISIERESDEEFLARARRGGIATNRVRLIAGDRAALCDATDGDPDLAIYAGEVTPAGRIEVLPFVHEQAVSITNHRFGNADRFSEAVI